MTETPGLTGHWDIDPSHSRLGFSTRHAMVSRVRGAFNNVTGSADIAEDLSDSTATVVIETASVDTRSADRDTHLRSADFFDVDAYPEIRFVSSAIDEVDEGSYIVTGDLTIRDMTKTVSIPLELIGVESDPFGNLRAGLEGSRRIDRKDWGVTWNTKLDSGGVLVSDKITLEFELSLIKNVAEAAPTDAADTTAEAEAPTEAPEPVTEAAPTPEADTSSPKPEAPESVTPTPAADETAPPAPKAPESTASVDAKTEPATDEFPPPPPVKPAESPADKPTEKAPEAKQSDSQSSGSGLGKLFGLR
ncbi:YceI family protein [Brevibacterium spongiae]|uniref:YceI family protein n=1 Tax=Brevibacterium spongiae TaxID=2909672 RepID=UPI003211BBDD